MDILTKLIQKELKRLHGRYRYHRFTHSDTGSDRNLNLMDRYEKEIEELQAWLDRINTIDRRIAEVNEMFDVVLEGVGNMVENSPDDRKLLMLQDYLRHQVREWRKKL